MDSVDATFVAQTEGSSKVVLEADETVAAAVETSTLNPLAKEWDPSVHKAPEEDRCLYLTFSNGFPLTEFEISTFFTEKFEAVVETVYIHRPQPGANHEEQHPLFGKVIFDSMYMSSLILSGEDNRKFVINGRTMWCKKFIPKAERNALGA